MNVMDEMLVKTADDFNVWLTESQRGDRCVYHIGHLATDKHRNDRIRTLAQAAIYAAGYVWGDNSTGQYTANYRPKHDRVWLFQRRFEKGFEYIAVKK